MPRYRLIDGLRGVAASLVLLAHVAFWTGASTMDVSGGLLARGDSGVAIFFAISAFLLLQPWLLAGATRPQPSVRTYAIRRAARILPAYWIALVAVLLVAVTWSASGGPGSPGTVLAHIFLVQGYTGQSYQAFSQTWSLTTEGTFYLLVPAIGVALGRLRRHNSRLCYGILAAVAVVGIAIQGGCAAWSLSQPHGHAGVLATCVLGHAAWFAVGAAISVAAANHDLDRFAAVGVGTWIAVGAVVFLVASSSLAGPRQLQLPTVAEAVTKETLYAILAGALLLAAVRGPSDQRWAAVARAGATRFVGDISYGVFLWHVLLLQLIYLLTGWSIFTGSFTRVLFAVGVFSVLIAWASAVLVEQPILRRVHRSPQRPRVPVHTA
ncbi:acyltransferase family protein [Rudaeicoccus suwonensis]|uniref:Peptidoglycan/LPS O-acetylase OafA/YrhL n=1 Tax=Rudaeicoccus suwonensis TaxID=657409 RepID=A0A561EAM4_9MICO|nr:acyltransferase [Rudaeicoccus suwonensis]TWE12637.1 peptidoglycan/LPS O-acetylase OafA/YrhL [Rudaeicoccus suwonensis]